MPSFAFAFGAVFVLAVAFFPSMKRRREKTLTKTRVPDSLLSLPNSEHLLHGHNYNKDHKHELLTQNI